MRFIWCVFFLISTRSAAAEVTVRIEAAEQDRTSLVVRLPFQRRYTPNPAPSVAIKGPDGSLIPGQLTKPGLLSAAAEKTAAEGMKLWELHFIVPKIAAGQTVDYTVLADAFDSLKLEDDDYFRWNTNPKNRRTPLQLGEQRVMISVTPSYDDSTAKQHEETKKIFHHVIEPKGKLMLTKGAGGLYSHHRGIFYGFSKLRYGTPEQNADTWHCNQGESQRLAKVVLRESGPVLGSELLAIDWHGKDGKRFAKEQREVTAYRFKEGTLIDFRSRLQSTVGKLKIDGDPQHAGFQFRASNFVASESAKQTYYLRPDGQGKPGETRNWDHKNQNTESNRQSENLPWNAMSFVVANKRYTVVYLDHPKNPKPARYSERDYGRFGSYFVTEIDGIETLDVRYRIWVQEGEMTVSDAQAKWAEFVEPPRATTLEP